MRNNEYTATPNWFKQEPTDSLANIYLTNYYLSGSASSGSGVLSSINLYNKYIISTYKLTVDDLFIPNTAIIAVDSELLDDQEKPEGSTSEVGNTVSAQDWYTSYSIRVLSGTTIKANLIANSFRYGIVFYNKYNSPISGYTPTESNLVDISVPEDAYYFKCCHYINPETESDSFYIEYQSVDEYNDSLLNEAYSGVFENFINTNSDINEGIVSDTIKNRALNLIFQQPLLFTIDLTGNIKIEINNDFLKDALIPTNYVTTDADDPLDILSQKDFKQGLKINGIEVIELNGFILIKGNLATTGGITTYTDNPNDPGSGGSSSGGTIESISISGEGNALTSVELSSDKRNLIFTKGETFATQDWVTSLNYIVSSLLSNYVTLNTDQEISGIKNFINGIKLNSQLIKIEDGILYLDCSVAVTGGLTVYALGTQSIPDIWEGAPFDNITIQYNPTTKVIEVIGGIGSSFDENAMWIALSSSDSSKQIDPSHISNALSGYATQSSLDTISTKLNDFLEGSDTDTIINKWKELEAFLSGMVESDNLAEILSMKADKTELEKYVTIATEQEITGIKHFINGLSVGVSKHRIYEQDGVVYLDGDLAVTGGVTAYALGDTDISTIMDGVVVDGVTITKVDGILTVLNAGGGEAGSVAWENITGKPSWISSSKPSYNWNEINSKPSWIGETKPTYNWNEILSKPTTLAGLGITDGINDVSVTGSGNAVTSAYVSGHKIILTKENTFLLSSQYTASDILSKLITVDGSGSGLDADMIDGKHISDIQFNYVEAKKIYAFNTTTAGSVSNTWVKIAKIELTGQYTSRQALISVKENYNMSSNSGTWAIIYFSAQQQNPLGGQPAVTVSQVGSLYPSNVVAISNWDAFGSYIDLYIFNDGAYNNFSVALIDGDSIINVSEIPRSSLPSGTNIPSVCQTTSYQSIKLQTPRNIWGQSFDGTSNVTGRFEIDGISRGSLSIYDNTTYRAIQTYKSMPFCINPEGNNVGIGEVSPREKLDVKGNIYSSGYYRTYHNSDSWVLYTARTDNTQQGGIWTNGFNIYLRHNNVNSVTINSSFVDINVPASIKSGATVTGNLFTSGEIISSYDSGTWINSLKNSVINCNISGYGGWINGKTKDGRIVISSYPSANNNLYFGYAAQSKIDAETDNSFTHQMFWSGDTGQLTVQGNLLVTGGVTCYSSDARAKTILEELNLSLKDIADSPTIRFKWNGWKIKNDGKTHIGGIAQYVQKILPETILEADGILNLDYATTAYIYAVLTARHLTKTDTEIDRLKKRIKKLEKQLKQLSYEENNIMAN